MSNPISFNRIPIFVDTALPDGEILMSDFKANDVRISPPPTDEELQVRAVARRLLGTDGALTFEMLQNAADRFFTAHHTAPDTIIMSPATRHEYIKLINADQRYGGWVE